LVPVLDRLVGAQLELGETIQQLVRELVDLDGPASDVEDTEDGPAAVLDITIHDEDDDSVREVKQRLARRVRRYRDGWKQVEQLGAVVKDPSEGLIDFYGRIDDRLVWLCWRYGEDHVAYYHELDAGFAERKPLEPIRHRMLN
jgi:hypothetical protein